MTMTERVPAFVAFGTNLPYGELHGPALIRAALDEIARGGLTLGAVSSMHTTIAWPDPSDPAFTNAVALFYAGRRDAQDVMALLLSVEERFGRRRSISNAPRTLDLDLIDFGGQVLRAPHLSLPHPRMGGRLFVLEPLAEIAPGWRHPETGETVEAMVRALHGSAAPGG